MRLVKLRQHGHSEVRQHHASLDIAQLSARCTLCITIRRESIGETVAFEAGGSPHMCIICAARGSYPRGAVPVFGIQKQATSSILRLHDSVRTASATEDDEKLGWPVLLAQVDIKLDRKSASCVIVSRETCRHMPVRSGFMQFLGVVKVCLIALFGWSISVVFFETVQSQWRGCHCSLMYTCFTRRLRNNRRNPVWSLQRQRQTAAPTLCEWEQGRSFPLSLTTLYSFFGHQIGKSSEPRTHY